MGDEGVRLMALAFWIFDFDFGCLIFGGNQAGEEEGLNRVVDSFRLGCDSMVQLCS